MNILFRELKAHRKSLLLWCIGIIAMVGIRGMSKYASTSLAGQSMNELISQMPKSLQALMGVGSLDLSKASGYFGILFLYLLLMATIHAVMLGANILSKEERDKTAEFLFVKPVSRERIISIKLTAALVNIVIFNVVTLYSSLFIVGHYSNGEAINQEITLPMTGMLLLQLLFLVIGTSIAAISTNPKKATSISTAILLGTFLLSIVIDLNTKLDFLKYVTPFKYFEASQVIGNSSIELNYIILSVLTIIVLSCITFVFYKKRDLSI